MRRIAAVQLLVSTGPSLLNDISHYAHRPYHAPVVELHLLGVERSMFRNNFSSTRYNYMVGVEFTARKLGLITTIGLN